MAKAKPNKRGRRKGEQTHIPGTGPEKNARVHPLAVEYVRTRDSRMELLKEETELKDRLRDAMREEGIRVYEYDDINVVVTTSEEIKVKRAKVEE